MIARCAFPGLAADRDPSLRVDVGFPTIVHIARSTGGRGSDPAAVSDSSTVADRRGRCLSPGFAQQLITPTRWGARRGREPVRGDQVALFALGLIALLLASGGWFAGRGGR